MFYVWINWLLLEVPEKDFYRGQNIWSCLFMQFNPALPHKFIANHMDD